MKIQIIIGSTRQNRFSEKPARWLFALARQRRDFETELLDLRDYPLPFYDEPVPAMMIKGNYTNELARKWAKKVGEGDGYIIVTPEYNHGYPAVLKNALDYVFDEWNGKPVAFVSYGGVLGARSVQQLQAVAIELRLVPLAAGLLIPPQIFREAAKNDQVNALFEPLTPFANTMINEVAEWAKQLQAGRPKAS
ncbi:MAG: NAD(P)H-dependent oxidoreductase [Candidatus Saganbacteria bacterium]|nr:NAD(P)H-dependent oxidoreductase [Candidatus Saganbacteria bacterium]